jgi:hypothetical protein
VTPRENGEIAIDDGSVQPSGPEQFLGERTCPSHRDDLGLHRTGWFRTPGSARSLVGRRAQLRLRRRDPEAAGRCPAGSSSTLSVDGDVLREVVAHLAR